MLSLFLKFVGVAIKVALVLMTILIEVVNLLQERFVNISHQNLKIFRCQLEQVDRHTAVNESSGKLHFLGNVLLQTLSVKAISEHVHICKNWL